MQEHNHRITKALASLFQAIANDPDKLTVHERLTGSVLEVTAEPSIRDVRLMIGKQGKTILGIRHVAEQMGKRAGIEVRVEVRDSFRGEAPAWKGFQLNREWRGEELTGLLREILDLLYGRLVRIVYEDRADQLLVILDVPHEDLTLVKAMGVAFYPFGYRNGRKLSFRIADYQPHEHTETTDSVPLPPGVARRMA